VEQRDTPLVQRERAERESASVLASLRGAPTAGDPDSGQATWVWCVAFLHVRRSTHHEQRLLVYGPKSNIWSAGQAMAKREGIKYFEARMNQERPPVPLAEFAFLSVV